MLLIKMTLVPLIIFIVSLVAKKWGPYVGGVIAGLPIIAGPITFFFAIERGELFAIESVRSTLLGVSALSTFCFIYSWVAIKKTWYVSLILGWSGYLVVSILIADIDFSPLASFMLVLVTVISQVLLSPKITCAPEKSNITLKEIAARMLGAAMLVALVTTFAEVIGPRYSGVFAVFPVAATILAVFVQINVSGFQASLTLQGLMVGLVGLSFFYFCLLVLSGLWGFYQAFYVSLMLVFVVQLVLQSGIKMYKNNKAIHASSA